MCSESNSSVSNKIFSLLSRIFVVLRHQQKIAGQLEKTNCDHASRPDKQGWNLSSDAADSQHSIILDQVENGVAVRMAVLYLLAGANG
jgi:aspartate carbamoyltransferase catalytic subunit